MHSFRSVLLCSYLLALGLAAPAVGQPHPAPPYPDLVATRAYIAEYVPPAQLAQYKPIVGPLEYGARVYLVCDIANQGRRPVKVPWQLGYFIDGKRVYTQKFGFMPPNRKQSPAAWYAPAAEGIHTYECRVDIGKVVREASETNNAARTRFTVKPWSVDLAVALLPQETGMWCWASGTQMAMQYLGVNVAQCDQANYRFHRNDCCTIQRCPNPVWSHACVQGGWPDLDHWGFTSLETSWGTALTFQQLTTEMLGRRPVLFAWGWTGGGGHLMVARGVTRVQGVDYVHMNDPWAPCVGNVRLVTYQEFVARAGDHVHWKDYYNITRKPAGDVQPVAFTFVDDGEGGVLGSIEPAVVGAKPAGGATAAETEPPPAAGHAPLHPTAKAAAAAVMRALGTDIGAVRALGLEPGDAGGATQGEPIRDFLVRLDELKAYATGGDPAKLLHETGAALVPVVVGSAVRTGVTVAKATGGYRTVAVGDESLTRAATAQLAQAPGGPAAAADRMMVRIPALRLWFIGRHDAGKLVLVPLLDDPRFDLKAAVPVDASVLFEKLVPAARETVPDVPA